MTARRIHAIGDRIHAYGDGTNASRVGMNLAPRTVKAFRDRKSLARGTVNAMLSRMHTIARRIVLVLRTLNGTGDRILVAVELHHS